MMGAKEPNPAPNRLPDGSLDPAYLKPQASPAPPTRQFTNDLKTIGRSVEASTFTAGCQTDLSQPIDNPPPTIG